MSFDPALIDRYEAAGPALRAAVAGLSREQLLSHPVAGKWSVQQLVLHLADCEQVFAERMKRVIAEPGSTLMGFDEDKWTAALKYEEQSAADAVELIVFTRRQMARVLRALPPAAFEQFGVHSSDGKRTLAEILGKALGHWDHHMKYMGEKLKALGGLGPPKSGN